MNFLQQKSSLQYLLSIMYFTTILFFYSKQFADTCNSSIATVSHLHVRGLLREHFAHLYGPATLIEDKKTLLFHSEEPDDLPLPLSTRSSSYRRSSLFPGVELRDKLKSHLEQDKKATAGTLRRAFSTNAYHKVRV